MALKLSRGQYISIVFAFLAFLVLYFGFDIKPKEQKLKEKSKALNMEITSIQNLLLEARDKLGANFNLVEAMNMELNRVENDSIKVEMLKKLSGKWYDLGFPAISGFYAQEVADIVNDGTAWSMAGTTYLIGVKESKDEKSRIWSHNRAIKAFEKAMSLDASNLDHQINLALSHLEIPPKDNPMKGILMLRNLNENNPRNVKVLSQLGRLSLMTNQIENALKRLKEAESVEPENKNVICLLAEAYFKSGESNLAETYNKKCISNN